eukprot:c24843_g1_i1 orf=631-3471(-)
MKQEDEEFEKLLGEIPHATNGSAHGENLVSAGAMPAACTIRDQECSMSTVNQNNPLPGSEVFGQFFPSFQVVDDLQQKEELRHSPSYSGVMPGIIASDGLSKLSSNGEDMQRHQPMADREEEEPLASLGFAESHSRQLPDDASLIAAFSKATLEAEPTPRHLMQSHDNNGDIMNGGVKTSTGLHNHLEYTQGIPITFDSSMESMASAFSDATKILPKKLGLSTSCTNGHSFSGPYRQEVYDNGSCSNARHAYANGGMMLSYTGGIGSAPPRSINDSIDYTRSYADYNRGYANPSYFGDGNGGQHGVVAFPHCNGIRSYVNETNSSLYYGGGSLDQVIGPKGTLHNSDRLDRLQLPPSSFHNIQFLSHQAEAPPSYVHLEQDVHWDASISQYRQAQNVCKMQHNWQREEDEMQRMQRNFDRSQTLGCAQHYQGPPPAPAHPCPVPSFYTAADQPCRPLHIGPIANMTDWKLQFCPGDLTKFSPQDLVPQPEDYCTFSTHGFCSREETCPISHTKCRNTARNRAFKLGAASPCGKVTPLVPREKQPICPVKILSRESSRAASTVVTLSCVDGNKETGRHMNGDVFSKDYQAARLLIEKQRFRGASIDVLEFDWPKGQVSLQGKYSSLEEVEGHIYSVAKDQHGCRFLQRQFDEGGPEEVEKIFSEIIDHILELMIDPFGNYLVQKLLEVCSEDQRLKILNTTTVNGELINVSLNMHGTRAVQKLIETLTSSQQVLMVTASLRPGVVTLIKDLNGNHVVQRCLQHLSSDDSQFIFEVVTSHCVEIATHRHGCCVLQRCIDFSIGMTQKLLIAEIAANALLLSQDPFGNYVVQYVLDLGMPWVSSKVIEQLAGHFAHLSMQKFSSNVVEKCLKYADEEHKTHLIQELMADTHLLELLQDPYANYVIQSALMVSKGTLHANLVEAICPHTPFLRSSPYGKRILSRRNLKKC